MDDDALRHKLQRQIDELLERRRISQARPLVATALAKFPDNVDLQLSAAWMEWLDDQPEEAARFCQSALQASPGSERGRYLMAGICEDLDDLKQAEAHYQSLLHDVPNDAEYLASLALLLFRTVQHDRARVLAEHAMSIAPENRRVQQAAFFSALEDGDRARVDAIIEQVMSDDPESMHNGRTLLIALRERHQYAEALRLARRILMAEPNDQDNVEQVIELTCLAHWSMAPLRRLDGVSEVAGACGLMGIGLLAWEATGAVGRALGGALLLFAVYSIAWPPILKRLIRR